MRYEQSNRNIGEYFIRTSKTFECDIWVSIYFRCLFYVVSSFALIFITYIVNMLC